MRNLFHAKRKVEKNPVSIVIFNLFAISEKFYETTLLRCNFNDIRGVRSSANANRSSDVLQPVLGLEKVSGFLKKQRSHRAGFINLSAGEAGKLTDSRRYFSDVRIARIRNVAARKVSSTQ